MPSRRPRACPVCGAECYACGTPGTQPGLTVRQATSGPVALYYVQVDGRQVRMKLNAADAAELGGVPVNPPPPAPMVTTTPPPAAKKRAAPNKSRSAANKSAS